MRATLKALIGIAAVAVCVAATLILTPTAASAQDLGGIVGGVMRGYGLPVPAYRQPVRRSNPSTNTTSHTNNNNKDSDEEESDSSSSNGKNAKNADKNCSDKNSSDKNCADKNANADNNKSRRQLSNAKDDGPASTSPPPGPAPAAKAEPAKATADDEPSFSPSR